MDGWLVASQKPSHYPEESILKNPCHGKKRHLCSGLLGVIFDITLSNYNVFVPNGVFGVTLFPQGLETGATGFTKYRRFPVQ